MSHQSTSAPPPTPPPGQTIILERRERNGWFRRLFWPVLILSVLINFTLLSQRTAGLRPDPLEEQYVSGSLNPTADKIAVVRVEGPIALSSVDFAVEQVRQARNDKRVKAVVLRVDSPGGTVTGSDQIWREINLLKQTGKPVIVSMGGLAASGGYYVSAPADEIIAEPTTTTGSIGVLIELPNASELLEKVGVQFEAVTAGEWKNMGSPVQPLEERDLARFQELVDDTYARFLRIVAQGRDLSMDEARAVAEGKIYSANEALAIGLVDRLGYQEDAIAEAAERAQLDSPRVVRYSKPISLGSLFGISASARTAPLFDEATIMEWRTPRMMMILR
ncbi:signal peptide peptidase SppA [Tautonia sp. JC769]|uniref:signal peptide peptidase SppA n=1 Tax=Tautonia sp. JC769 TaxID=3232135 RepID=UPI0034586840